MSYIMMHEDKIKQIVDESGGVCILCGAVEHSHIEPDAVNYLCSECGERGVVGIEIAIVEGFIIPTKEKHPMLSQYMKDKYGEE